MRDVMIDIETLSTRVNACITTIGAVEFNIDTGEINDCLYQLIDIEPDRFAIDAKTLGFWFEQVALTAGQFDATDLQRNNRVPLHVALANLDDFIYPSNRVWANGTDFDLAILKNAYCSHNMAIPWEYNAGRDMRTIREAAELLGGPQLDFQSDGVLHDALDDAKNQARYVAACWRAIKNGGN